MRPGGEKTETQDEPHGILGPNVLMCTSFFTEVCSANATLWLAPTGLVGRSHVENG